VANRIDERLERRRAGRCERDVGVEPERAADRCLDRRDAGNGREKRTSAGS
jgi:hypothetical protein